MKIHNPIADLTRFEKILWTVSSLTIFLSSILTGLHDPVSLIGSLIGVTALIFVAKGHLLGQVLLIFFSLFYGITSFAFAYYGEMITYLGMSAPMAVVAIVSWARHPFGDTHEVEIASLTKKKLAVMCVLAVIVTLAFYFILKALGNASLIVSTISVTTSFVAAYLTYLRSPYYALGYAVNDIVLIVLWVLAAIKDISSLPMLVCFVMFLANDLYGFTSWKRRQMQQKNAM